VSRGKALRMPLSFLASVELNKDRHLPAVVIRTPSMLQCGFVPKLMADIARPGV
jgi:hypothetical protein